MIPLSSGQELVELLARRTHMRNRLLPLAETQTAKRKLRSELKELEVKIERWTRLHPYP